MVTNLINFIKNNSVLITLCLFPFCVILRSGAINAYFILLSVILILNFKNYSKIIFERWMYIFLVFIFFTSISSYFSENHFDSLKSSISQIRFLLFVMLLSTFKIKKNHIRNFIYIVSTLITLVCFDVFYQYYFGYDIFGFEPGNPLTNPHRLSGPFNNELIVGSYVYLISIPLISYYFYDFQIRSKMEKCLSILFSILVFFTILLSGERMAFILFATSITLLFLINFNFKRVLGLSSLIVILFVILFNTNTSVNNRFTNFMGELKNFNEKNHYKLFVSALDIWSQNKFIGVGLKNFRVKCDENKINNITKLKNVCSTHPHNFYMELLSETGIVGLFLFTIFIFLLLKYIYNQSSLIDNEFRGLFFGSAVIILMYAWPIKSSGSFFSTFTASFFWFNTAIICLISNNKKK